MKRFISFLTIAAIALFSLSIPAFADNETAASTELSYTLSSSYLIDIPASVNLNEAQYIDFTAQSVYLDSGKKVYVKIDEERSLAGGGAFFLHMDNGTEYQSQLECSLYVSSPLD